MGFPIEGVSSAPFSDHLHLRLYSYSSSAYTTQTLERAGTSDDVPVDNYIYTSTSDVYTHDTHVYNTSPGALVCVCALVNIHRCRVRLYAVLQSRAQYRYARTCHTYRLRKTYPSPFLPTVAEPQNRVYTFLYLYTSLRVICLILLLSSSSRRTSSCSRQFTLGESFVYFCFFLFDIIGTYIKSLDINIIL